VNTRRPDRDDVDAMDNRESEAIVLAAGTLRTGESRTQAHPEERLSLFWRVFGGTILSIGALVAVTLYNNVTSNINELRSEVNRVNEARADLVKKEEFSARTQNLWDRVQNLQELRVTVTSMKEQVSGYAEKKGEVKNVRDQLALVEQRLKSAEDDHKAVAKAELAISTLEQKAVAREAQLKVAEDDRRELARQVQELRERLAKVEGVTEVKPMPKGPAGKNN
jgi:DNA repair exonuclease SbcCD ATPase subunit